MRGWWGHLTQNGCRPLFASRCKLKRRYSRMSSSTFVLTAGGANRPAFVVDNCVMVAMARKRGELPKLVPTWTGPWRVVSVGGQQV